MEIDLNIKLDWLILSILFALIASKASGTLREKNSYMQFFETVNKRELLLQENLPMFVGVNLAELN